jgi:hypothetical protein
MRWWTSRHSRWQPWFMSIARELGQKFLLYWCVNWFVLRWGCRGHYRIAVVGRGLQVINFHDDSSTFETDSGLKRQSNGVIATILPHQSLTNWMRKMPEIDSRFQRNANWRHDFVVRVHFLNLTTAVVASLIGVDVCDLIGNADGTFCCPCLFVRPSPCVFELISFTCEVNQQWGTWITSWNRPWQNLLPLDGMSLIYIVLTQNSSFLPCLVEGTRTWH